MSSNFLLRNAEGFLHSAVMHIERDGSPKSEAAMQALGYALELLLKAFLMSKGWTDDRRRVELRHDLKKALDAAEHEGLAGVSPELRSFIETLSPYYRSHRLEEWINSDRCRSSRAALILVLQLADMVQNAPRHVDQP